MKKSIPLHELQIHGVIPKATEMKRFSDCNLKQRYDQASNTPQPQTIATPQLQAIAKKRSRVIESSSTSSAVCFIHGFVCLCFLIFVSF